MIETFETEWQHFTWIKGSQHLNSHSSVSVDISDHGFTDSVSASTHTVKLIQENFPPPYILCCTGGIDSQAMLHAWGFATDWDNTAFQVVSFMYNDHCNQYDMEGLQEICDKHNITRKTVDFDLMQFMVSGECTEYQLAHYTQSPQMAAHIKLMETFDRGTVLMSGELLPKQAATTCTVNHFSVIKYAVDHNLTYQHKKVIPFFFEHNDIIATAHWKQMPEHPKSNLKNEQFSSHDWVLANKLETYNQRILRYNSCGYPVTAQPQTVTEHGKASGFELFKTLYEDVAKISAVDKLKLANSSNASSPWKYDLLHRYKIKEHVIYSDVILELDFGNFVGG